MSKTNPLVSVIITNFNHQQYVLNAIESVVSQDYKQKQICVIDDCSTDDSLNTILSLIPNYKTDKPEFFAYGIYQGTPIFVLKNNTNLKQSKSRNLAIKTMWNQSDLFAILDSDDIYLPTKLTKSVNKLIENPEIGVVYSDLIITNNNYKIREFREPFNILQHERNCQTTNTPLFTKEALSKVGLYDENIYLAEDWDLTLRISEQFLVVHIPEALSEYTVTGDNCTIKESKEKWQQSWQYIFDKLQKRRGIV